MNRKQISLDDCAGLIFKQIKRGVLVTTRVGKRLNAMTISWGSLGFEWGKPIFTIYIRQGRFTHEMLEANGEFTVNIPVGDFDRKILGVCGAKSGRDIDKFKELGLTPVDSAKISVPGIAQLPLTLECKVIYKQTQDINMLPPEIRDTDYPQDVPSSFYGSNRDAHTAYYGEILNAYIIEP